MIGAGPPGRPWTRVWVCPVGGGVLPDGACVVGGLDGLVPEPLEGFRGELACGLVGVTVTGRLVGVPGCCGRTVGVILTGCLGAVNVGAGLTVGVVLTPGPVLTARAPELGFEAGGVLTAGVRPFALPSVLTAPAVGPTMIESV